MSLSSTNQRNDYTGNGAVDTYAYSFRIFANTDLVVTVRNTSDVETTLVLTTDYTVTGVGDASGGNVVLVNSSQAWLDVDGDLKSNYVLTIRRVRPLTQTTDIRNSGDFFPETHEDAFDHFVMISQQLDEVMDRSTKLPETIPAADFDNTLPTDITASLNTVLMTNATGDGWEMGATADEISNAQTYATNAAASAAAALVSETNADTSEANAAASAAAALVSENNAATSETNAANSAANPADNSVTNAKLADMATQTIKGRTTAGTGDPEDLTVTQATAMLNAVVGDSGSGGTKGLVPAPAAGDAAALKFLKADGTWVTPASGSVSWTEVTGTTQTMSVNNAYIANNAAQVALTLPATSSVGDIIYVVGKGAGGWSIKSNASAAAQTVKYSLETSPTSSSSAISLRISVYAADAIQLVCTTANSVWTAMNEAGSSQPYISATGGTITTDGDYKVHSFTSSGTFTVTSGSGAVDTLVVAGGAGSSSNGAGGGGAGGVVSNTATQLGTGTYTVTVGAGGAGINDLAGSGTRGTNGSNSSFINGTGTAVSYTATGGGGGAYITTGGSGGSGGGGSSATNAGGAGTVGQGNDGGAASGGVGGGGGGAGAVGSSGSGNGGAGTASSITGASVTYGGGGGGSDGAGTNGTGGSGGGGAAAATGNGGTANTGGGGGASNGDTDGGDGGSGIVIVRYQFQ